MLYNQIPLWLTEMSNEINHKGGKGHRIKPQWGKCHKIKYKLVPYFKGIPQEWYLYLYLY